jgi:type IV secretion system protein TrbL
MEGNSMKAIYKAALIGACVMLYSSGAAAQLTNQGVLDQVVTEFATKATSWQAIVLNAATWLFWTLGTISLVWTAGMMILRKADIGEFFAEFVRFILFFGFFLWLLRNGPEFANSIIQSLQKIGEQASGVASVTPSSIVDVGFMIWKQAISNLSAWSPIDSFVGAVLSAGIMVLLAVIAVNMLLLLVSAWILMYAGVFFLGFGGSRWTSDMAINYYKTVLGIAVQLFTMILLIGIGNDLLMSFYAKMNKGTLNFEELGVMLVFCVALLMLINRVPPLLAGIITGSGVGNAGGIGNFGAGAAMGAASMAAGAAGVAGSAIMGGASQMAGGASAVKAAFSAAQANMGGDSGSMPSFGGSGSGGDGDAGTGDTPFAQAAGFGGSSGGGGADSGGDAGGESSGESSGKAASSGGGQSGGGSSSAAASGGGASSASAASGSTASGGESDSSSASTANNSGNDSGKSGKDAGSGSGGAKGQAAGGGFLAAAAKAGRITADAGGILAKGMGSVAKAKAASIKESAMERIANTTGGKIAVAINERNSGSGEPVFNDSSISGSQSSGMDDEVAAFVNKNPSQA